jgi:tetratricopeptide (TPR) repeat protein
MPQVSRLLRRWLVLSLAAASAAPFPSWLRAEDTPATQPANATAALTPESQKKLTDAIDLLGSDDFKTREEAANTVWGFGEAAIPALKEAAQSDNPEIARRARSILGNFAFGIRPDTPRAVIEQLNLYRKGNDQERRQALGELTRLGPAGGRVLARIARDEQDAELRQIALNGVTMLARPTAASMIRNGEWEMAGNILAMVAHQDEGPARDMAAFLLLHGGLDNEIARLRQPSNSPANANIQLRLACLLRAKGDLKGAITAANASDDKVFADALRVEAGDYAGLAADIEAKGVSEGSIEEMGFIMAYHRLAGQTAEVDRWAKKIIEYGRANSANDTHRDCAEALFLNERPKEAMDLLVEVKDPLLAMEYVAARFEFKLTEELVEKTRDNQSGELPRVLAKSAPMLHHQGRTKEAIERLLAVSRGENGPVDAACWEELIEAAPLSGLSIDKVDEWLAQAMTTTARQNGLADRLFRRARYLDPTRAQVWWEILRDHRMAMTPLEVTKMIRKLDRGQITGLELTALVERVKDYASKLPRSDQRRRMMMVADVLVGRDRFDDALALYQSLLPPPEGMSDGFPIHLAIADLHLKAKRWEQAADAYADASKLDPSDPRPVALEGWARTQLGKKDEGKRLLELAHLMPLGDESVRNDLANTLNEHGVPAEARRERELIAILGAPRSWAYCDALRRLAGDVNKSDPLAAAAMWDRAFLANLSTQTSFIDPTANLTIPVLIRRTKAIGHIRTGKLAEGLDDAKQCLDAYPADADSQIAIVRELDKLGKKKEADEVYRRAFDRFDAIRKQYPESGQTNNLVAWLTACVKRDLDHALTCAKKGVELEPDNTAILDTLSEVYFARGEYDQALKINEKCRTMEPYVEHHKKNQARFTAAKEGKKVEGATPEDEE